MRRLVCALRGHRIVRIIMSARILSADEIGGIMATPGASRLSCMRCGRDL